MGKSVSRTYHAKNDDVRVCQASHPRNREQYRHSDPELYVRGSEDLEEWHEGVGNGPHKHAEVVQVGMPELDEQHWQYEYLNNDGACACDG